MISANRLRCASRRLLTLTVRRKSATPIPETSATAATAAAKAAQGSSTNNSTRLVVQSLAAAGAGVVTVSLAAAAVEQATANTVPAFTLHGQRFAPEHFAGRFCQMLLACDPRLLLYTHTQVLQAQDLLQRWQAGQAPHVSDRALWEAKRVVTSALHPDTGDVIPRPFRMSGYVPYNGRECCCYRWIDRLIDCWCCGFYSCLTNLLSYTLSSNHSHLCCHGVQHVHSSLALLVMGQSVPKRSR